MVPLPQGRRPDGHNCYAHPRPHNAQTRSTTLEHTPHHSSTLTNPRGLASQLACRTQTHSNLTHAHPHLHHRSTPPPTHTHARTTLKHAQTRATTLKHTHKPSRPRLTARMSHPNKHTRTSHTHTLTCTAQHHRQRTPTPAQRSNTLKHAPQCSNTLKHTHKPSRPRLTARTLHPNTLEHHTTRTLTSTTLNITANAHPRPHNAQTRSNTLENTHKPLRPRLTARTLHPNTLEHAQPHPHRPPTHTHAHPTLKHARTLSNTRLKSTE
jgi:hypothetical protein